MLVNFQDWLSSIQQAAYLPATSMTMTFSESLRIIRSLIIKKAHDHDTLRIIKICDKAKCLSIIHKNCIDTGIFPDLLRKSNIVPV